MLKKILKILIILAILLIISGFIIIIGKNMIDIYINKKLITDTYQTFTEENIEKNLSDGKIISLKYKENDILGILKIEDIGFEGVVYKGTTLDVLKIGVGHFENTPNFDGNVCFAAHNTSKFWAKLKTIKKGSKIIYTSYLGQREYEVFSNEQIEETDWNPLENTKENIITLITCVKGEKSKRLCIQAKQI